MESVRKVLSRLDKLLVLHLLISEFGCDWEENIQIQLNILAFAS